jgi:hypothetical protein
MDPLFRPDLHNTAPPVEIRPAASWFDPTKIVSMDPWGHMITHAFGSHLKDGTDIRPSVSPVRGSFPNSLHIPNRLSWQALRRQPDGEMHALIVR